MSRHAHHLYSTVVFLFVSAGCTASTSQPTCQAAALTAGSTVAMTVDADPGMVLQIASVPEGELVATGLPPGVQLTSAGYLRNAPTAAGTFAVTLTNAGNGSCAGNTTPVAITVNVTDPGKVCKIDNDCLVVKNGFGDKTCKTSADCASNPDGNVTCVVNSAGYKVCLGDASTAGVCGNGTTQVNLKSTEGKSFFGCAQTITAFTCNARNHCVTTTP
jgi:hypothetical protein